MTDSSVVITNRTVRVQSEVFLTRNVCTFGLGSVPKYSFSWSLIMGLGLLGLFLLVVSSVIKGSILFFFAVAGVAAYLSYLKITDPRRFGLMITMASGERRFFPTGDKNGLATATQHVTSLLEGAEQDRIANLTINKNRVDISNSNVGGSVAGGDISDGFRGGQ